MRETPEDENAVRRMPEGPTPPAARFFRHPVTAVVTTALSMFAMIIISGLISAGLYLLAAAVTGAPANGPLKTTLATASYLVTTAVAVLLILLWRRLARLPVRGIGIAPLSRAWLLLPGFALAIGVDYASAGVAVSAGASHWAPDALASLTFVAVVGILFGQALPEELLWRGHLAGLLSHRMTAPAVILITSAGFGVLHIVSGSEAQGPGEQLLYVLQATALGVLLIALRLRTASLWTAVGFHAGYNVFFEVAAPVPGSYGTELIARTVLLLLCATAILMIRKPGTAYSSAVSGGTSVE